MSKNKSNKDHERLIITNKKARHDYHLERFFEAGLVLEGWEVKSIRANKVQIRDSYVILKNGEAWLIGTHITPLNTVSTHFQPDSQRTRKLLLHENELAKLFGAVNRQGYTIVPVDLHWHKNRVKVEIALAKGKQAHDKRETLKEREWDRQKQRILKR
ncbi:MAG: SsrA-binding protein [Coxiella sp. RIFCSPHIGHO2_12_FULL_42_15]|nr:MAG: SsrA-binding protein [Coxiella sp. RIFCSPHIGHO2_12_FULL_42_15]